MAVPTRQARQRRLLAIASVSLVVMMCAIIAANIVGETEEWWAWTLLVPIGMLVPAIVGATAVVLLLAERSSTRAAA